MRKIIGVAALAAVLGGCDITPETAVYKGREMVASQLKDPDSAQFGEMFFVERKSAGELHSGDLCGSVNARNSFGGYTGMTRFVADFSYTINGSFTLRGLQMDDGSTKYGEQWSNRCRAPGTHISG